MQSFRACRTAADKNISCVCQQLADKLFTVEFCERTMTWWDLLKKPRSCMAMHGQAMLGNLIREMSYIFMKRSFIERTEVVLKELS